MKDWFLHAHCRVSYSKLGEDASGLQMPGCSRTWREAGRHAAAWKALDGFLRSEWGRGPIGTRRGTFGRFQGGCGGHQVADGLGACKSGDCGWIDLHGGQGELK